MGAGGGSEELLREYKSGLGAKVRRASGRLSTPDQFDPELAESGCFGRWKGLSERGRNTARGIDQRTFEQPLSSLRARPLVRTRGEEPVAGRSPAGALYR